MGAGDRVERPQMHSFLRKNIYSEIKHLVLRFCVHASLFVENGPEVKCRCVPSLCEPLTAGGSEWHRLRSTGTTQGSRGERVPMEEHVLGPGSFPSLLKCAAQYDRSPEENPYR